ncbi:uncharacterized protein TRIVIDRAFT_196998 [Trichoderma virens Gv29-8]|uniref:Uncharacterized protein n=1 Tax=Hypocrea virens (strain Gv29-8 / FGSC 10586) TaxID=413071 RepID=G9MFG4_HYPVG|nr:uncharacterized protein TRIVIDRAFT_196998 [Trichoderma virens Gv29-8]EHK27130.1 hypothetical protein TRIVIDRAFT_196998 [Trichoderma virens Gv29-8]UKZ57584.1 hypothetical protein TrVGV298_011444 [Trichoderma virens]
MRASNATSGEGRRPDARQMEPPQEKPDHAAQPQPQVLSSPVLEASKGKPGASSGRASGKEFSRHHRTYNVPPHGRPSNIRSDKTAGRCPEKKALGMSLGLREFTGRDNPTADAGWLVQNG